MEEIKVYDEVTKELVALVFTEDNGEIRCVVQDGLKCSVNGEELK